MSNGSIIEILSNSAKNFNVTFTKNATTARMNTTFQTKLKETHPIHQFLKTLENSCLKDIANKIGIEYHRKLASLRPIIAKYFFKAHSEQH